MDLVFDLCQAFAFQRSLGHEGVASDFALHILDRSRPDDRTANHTSRVRAQSDAEITALLKETDKVFSHCAHRLYFCDPLTPPQFVARLLGSGYEQGQRQLAMVRRGDISPVIWGVDLDVSFTAVKDAQDWKRLATLCRVNQLETSDSPFMATSNRKVDRIIDGWRKRAPSYQFYLAQHNQQTVGYVAGTLCPNGVGVIADLFVASEMRRRGCGTTLLGHVTQQLRGSGAKLVTLQTPVDATSMELVVGLDFSPQCVMDSFVRNR